MSELDLRFNPFRDSGYPHDPIFLWNDLYFLAAIFGASNKISKLKKNGDGEKEYSIFSIFRSFEYSEISRRLLSVAVICRNEMQTQAIQDEKNTIGNIKLKGSKIKNLDTYNGCNKIIHADYINFDLTDNSNVRSGYLKPIIYLYGKEKGKEWKATINIFDFINEVFNIF